MKRALIAILALAACAAQAQAQAQVSPDELLDADQAFRLQASAPDRQTMRLHWDIAEGYYMYRHSLEVRAVTEEVELGEPAIPSGKRHQDEFFGQVETYRDSLAVRVPVAGLPADADTVEVRVSYQGCADLGVCYPPTHKTVSLSLPDATTSVASGGPPAGGDSLDAALRQISPGGLAVDDAVQDGEALPPRQAFRYEAINTGPGEVLVRMTPAPGYYLYRDKFGFESASPDIVLGPPQLPPGKGKNDPHFGDVRVYYEQVEIPIALQRDAGPERSLELVAEFQGCKDGGICYPPMRRSVQVHLPPAPDATKAPAMAGSADTDPAGAGTRGGPVAPAEQDRLAGALGEAPLVALGLFFLAGLLLAFTPCVFPMVPILAGIIAGQGEDITRGRAFTLSLVYVLAMALTYSVVGVAFAAAGSSAQAAFQNPWIIGAFAAVLVLLSLAMFGFYDLQLPPSWQTRLNQVSNSQRGGTFAGVAVMGLLSALIVGPCVAPALMGALIYIGQTGDEVLGGTALFSLALGMGLPLLVIGTSAGELLPRAGAWMDAVKAVFGVALLALAIWMLERVMPGRWPLLLWGLLMIGSGVFMGALDSARLGWPRLWKALGLALVLFGALELVGFGSGADDWTRPLKGLGGGATVEHAVDFKRVETLDELRNELAQNRPVMLDFYADWCVECVRMENTTFADPQVASTLQGINVLQVDVTANDAEDRRLLREFDLIGPPAILFFGADGDEQRDLRLIGYMAAEPFMQRLRRAFGADTQ